MWKADMIKRTILQRSQRTYANIPITGEWAAKELSIADFDLENYMTLISISE